MPHIRVFVIAHILFGLYLFYPFYYRFILSTWSIFQVSLLELKLYIFIYASSAHSTSANPSLSYSFLARNLFFPIRLVLYFSRSCPPYVTKLTLCLFLYPFMGLLSSDLLHPRSSPSSTSSLSPFLIEQTTFQVLYFVVQVAPIVSFPRLKAWKLFVILPLVGPRLILRAFPRPNSSYD